MSAVGFTLFDTAIGRCGLAWGAAGLVAVQLPDTDERRLRSRLAARATGLETFSPPPFATDAILRIMRLFEGTRDDLATIPLDMAGVPAFHRDVYALTRAIPPGATLTYGEWRSASAMPASPAPSARRSAAIHFRSWCRATA